jgi:hypothetical protein
LLACHFSTVFLLALPVGGDDLRMKYLTGHEVVDSGIYRVTHAQHRLPHTVTICKGEMFPRCAKCDNRVTFELVHEAECGFSYEPIHVYELQPLQEENDAAAAAAATSSSSES